MSQQEETDKLKPADGTVHRIFHESEIEVDEDFDNHEIDIDYFAQFKYEENYLKSLLDGLKELPPSRELLLKPHYACFSGSRDTKIHRFFGKKKAIAFCLLNGLNKMVPVSNIHSTSIENILKRQNPKASPHILDIFHV